MLNKTDEFKLEKSGQLLTLRGLSVKVARTFTEGLIRCCA